MLNPFASHVVAACRLLDGKGVTPSSVEDSIRNGVQLPLTRARAAQLKRGLHSVVRRRLAEQDRPHWQARLRARLEGDQLDLLPGLHPTRALRAAALLPAGAGSRAPHLAERLVHATPLPRSSGLHVELPAQ